MARSSWRQARNIRRLTNLSVVEMAAMDPVWAAYEDGDVDMTPASLRALLGHQERLGAATSVVAFTILALERRPAQALAQALGVTADCIARWRSLGRDIPPRLAPRLVELVARRWW